MTSQLSVEERIEAFDQKLFEYGYVPTEDGSLIHASEEELEDLAFHDFIWYDFQLVQEIIAKNSQEPVFVCTYHAADTTFVSEGWHVIDRDGYLLTSQCIMEPREVIDFGDGQH